MSGIVKGIMIDGVPAIEVSRRAIATKHFFLPNTGPVLSDEQVTAIRREKQLHHQRQSMKRLREKRASQQLDIQSPMNN